MNLTALRAQGSKVLVASLTPATLTFSKSGNSVTFEGADSGMSVGDVVTIGTGQDLPAGSYAVKAVDDATGDFMITVTGGTVNSGDVDATLRRSVYAKEITPPRPTVSPIVDTHLGSTFERNQPGQLSKYTQLTFSYTKYQNCAGQDDLEEMAFSNGSKMSEFDVVYSDGSYVRFTGWISGLPETGITVDGLVGASATVEIYTKPEQFTALA